MSDRDHVTLEPVKQIRVRKNGATIAETSHGFVVHERGLPDRFYIPRRDVRATVHDGKGAGVCPWKGKWRHVDVEIGGARVSNLAWTYYETTATCDPVRDHLAFYEDKVELEVER